jgi:hypothetical protein
MKHFSVHFNVHTPMQIVFLNNLKIVGPLIQNETLHQERSQDR